MMRRKRLKLCRSNYGASVLFERDKQQTEIKDEEESIKYKEKTQPRKIFPLLTKSY